MVQLDIDGQPYLRFGEEDWFIHAAILMDLASKLERGYPKIYGKAAGRDIPAPESDWYKVHGTGKTNVDVERKEVSLFGESVDYGLGIDPEHLDLVRPLIPDWTIELR